MFSTHVISVFLVVSGVLQPSEHARVVRLSTRDLICPVCRHLSLSLSQTPINSPPIFLSTFSLSSLSFLGFSNPPNMLPLFVCRYGPRSSSASHLLPHPHLNTNRAVRLFYTVAFLWS